MEFAVWRLIAIAHQPANPRALLYKLQKERGECGPVSGPESTGGATAKSLAPWPLIKQVFPERL